MTDLTQLQKSMERWKRGLPWDRVVKSTKEAGQFMKDVEHVTKLCAEVMEMGEKQERELQAFKDTAAEGMEIHKGDTE